VFHFQHEAAGVVGAQTDYDALFLFGEAEEWFGEALLGGTLAC